MDNMLFYTHSGVRWLVVLLTLVAFIWLTYGMATRKPFDKRTQVIVSVWSGFVGLQWILGILVFLVLGGFDLGYRWEHATIMTIALGVAHAYVPLKKRADNVRYQGIMASIMVVMILVFIGVSRLPQGWTMEVNAPGDSEDVPAAEETPKPGASAEFIIS
jgi:hypothetical protein